MSRLEALKREALAMGAELEVDGQVFNAAREAVHLPKQKPAAPTPVFGMADVERMLAERDATWQDRLDEQSARMTAARNELKAQIDAADREAKSARAVMTAMSTEHAALKGRIAALEAKKPRNGRMTPKYLGGRIDAIEIEFDPQ